MKRSRRQVDIGRVWVRAIPVLFVALCADGLPAHADQANSELTIVRSRITGKATFVTAADGGAIPVQFRSGAGRVEPGDFLVQFGHLFGVTDPANQLVQVKVDTDALGHTHTTYEQVHFGIRVFSGVLKVHNNVAGLVIAANGDFYPISPKLDTLPTIDAQTAEANALEQLWTDEVTTEHNELVIVDPGWYGDPPQGTHLAYYVILANRPAAIAEAFFIDAHSGEVLDQWSLIHNSRDRAVYDGEGLPGLPGVLVRDGTIRPPGSLTRTRCSTTRATPTTISFVRSVGTASTTPA